MSPRLETAVEAVRRACRLTRAVQAALVSEDTLAKQDRSPVTVADFGAQALISLDLLARRPGEAIMGEEDAESLRQPEQEALRGRVVEEVRRVEPRAEAAAILDAIDRCAVEDGSSPGYWILDPIDGTKGFLRQGQYAVALAWAEDRQVRLGVLGCPNLDPADGDGGRGAILAAEKGQGTYLFDLEGKRLRRLMVSEIADPAEARFCESVEAAHSAHDHHARIAGLLGVHATSVRMDSQAKYAALARGDAAIYLRLPRRTDYREKVWDHAAGALVVEEAGGRVTDARGEELDFTTGRTLDRNRGIVATSGAIHERVLDAVLSVVPS